MVGLYRPKPYGGRTVVYVDDQAPIEAVRARWQRLLTGPWELVTVAGDHFTVLREPNVRALAADLRERIFGLGLDAT